MTIYQVDAFADRPFAGNPAGVCVLSQPRDEQWMKDIAREMNLSETAFLQREGGVYRLRWFTPAVEVKLCGHATLASAHVLWETGAVEPSGRIHFETLSGTLTADRSGQDITLNFPAKPVEPADPPPGLLEALGAPAKFVGRSAFDYLVELEFGAIVRNLQPDLTRLAQVKTRGTIVTSRSDDTSSDFVSRFFAPASGVNEDPVTGSAHCSLAPYWAAKLGRTQLTGYQASARGGTVRVTVQGDRVLLGGRAITVMRCELLV